jgi:hypothetical protein
MNRAGARSLINPELLVVRMAGQPALARRDDHCQMSRPRRDFKKVEQSDNREQELGALRHFLQQWQKRA